MKIVHLVFSLNVGGTESMLLDIVSEQSRSHEVLLIVINRDYQHSLLSALDNRVALILVNRPPLSKNVFYFLKLNYFLYKIKPSIIHCHNYRIIDFVSSRFTPIVATIHDTFQKTQTSIAQYSKVFAISNAVRRHLLTYDPSLDIGVIHNGIRFSEIPRKTTYGGVPFRLIQIGRLDHATKGQDITIQALRFVNDEVGQGSVNVTFIGEGKSIKYLQGLAQALEVSRWCTFSGLLSRQDLYRFLCTFDLLIQPSRSEGFGLTVLEAMAAAVPVLVSDINGPMEIIENGRYGLFFRSDDFEDCGKKIIQAMSLSNHQNTATTLYEVAEYAKRYFDVSITADKYLAAYQQIIHSLCR